MKTSKKLLLALFLVVAGSSACLDAMCLRSGRNVPAAQDSSQVEAGEQAEIEAAEMQAEIEAAEMPAEIEAAEMPAEIEAAEMQAEIVSNVSEPGAAASQDLNEAEVSKIARARKALAGIYNSAPAKTSLKVAIIAFGLATARAMVIQFTGGY